MDEATGSGRWNFSRLATYCRTRIVCVRDEPEEGGQHCRTPRHLCLHAAPRRVLTSSSSGAATLTSKQRDRMGAMILLVDVAQRIKRKLPIYFSIVRRKADWASRERESASLITTTGRGGAQRSAAKRRRKERGACGSGSVSMSTRASLDIAPSSHSPLNLCLAL